MMDPLATNHSSCVKQDALNSAFICKNLTAWQPAVALLGFLYISLFSLLSLSLSAGEDFESLTEVLTFGNNLTSSQNPLSANLTDPSTQKCIPLLVLNDIIAEKEEAFHLIIEQDGSDQNEVQLLPSQATVFITDNDGKQAVVVCYST